MSTSTGCDSAMSLNKFHRIADETLDEILDVLECSDSVSQIPGNDVIYSSGVLTMHLGAQHGTWVLNKQPPTRQIWTSSPIAGPRRYELDESEGVWKCIREKTELRKDLQTELRSILKDETLSFL
ncbi:MAG: hypothetical protein SGCHY_005503 [Lobulomycetales sp.]